MHSSSLFLIWVIFFIFSKTFSPSSSTSLMPPNNVTLYGEAHLRNNAVSLTREHNCPPSSTTSSGVGRALFLYPIRFLDLVTNTSASLFCHFTFTIIPSPLCSFGDGLAFLITSNADSFSLSNGYLGLPGPAMNEDSFIAIEFDTRYDSSHADINGNHIGVDISNIVSFASVDALSRGIDLKSGKRISVWIEYIDSAKLIQVWVSYSLIKPQSPILVAQVDLSDHFKEYMHVGFSASNGPGSAAHIIHHWRFRTYTSVPSASSINMSEDDCVMCTPQDLRNNERPIKPLRRKVKIGDLVMGLGGLAAFVLSMIAILSIITFFVMKKKRGVFSRDREGEPYRVNRVPTRLPFSEIKAATLGFNRNRIVGTGASATVYKGSLPAGEAVAVKRFDRAGIDGIRNPFLTEFATMVGCLRHKNLVQLQGWCCEGSELVLVYEYLPNGSLDKVLHKKTGSEVWLSWKQRLNIILGVASALSYLHEECERQIIHRDVKTCNIMLDKEFNAKLGDFGLAEVYEHSSMTREATIPAGTMGYLAPEYVYSGVPTQKTDIYSFGVVILEVATGRRPVEDDGTVLVDWVWKCWEKGKLIKAADSRLKGKFNVAEMERMLVVGLSCVHPNHEKRPTVKEAARILRDEAPLPVLPARKPKVGFQHAVPVDSDAFMNFTGDQSPSTEAWMTPRSHFN